MYFHLKKLSGKSGDEFLKKFTDVPENVSELDLKLNELDSQSNNDLKAAFAIIKQSVCKLGLASTDLFLRCVQAGGDPIPDAATNLREIFGVLPKSIIQIDISKNFRGFPNALVQALSAIPTHIETINLARNGINGVTVEQLDSLKNCFPKVTSVYFSMSEIESMKPEQLKALKEVFPNLKNTYLLDENGAVVRNNHIHTRKLGFPAPIPSLQNMATFFVNPDEAKGENVPEPIRNMFKKDN